jgi:hypothetical protein
VLPTTDARFGSDRSAVNPLVGDPFGSGPVGRVGIAFLAAPKPTAHLREPCRALVAEKQDIGASRRVRWFGRH